MIYVTRHGQTNWNIQKKVMGRCDEPLNTTGIEQAMIVRDKLKNINFDMIICSPLLRAKQTAEIINENKKIPIVYDNRIIERDFGEFEGLETKDFDFKGYWNYYSDYHYKKAENIQIFFERIYNFLDEVTEEYIDANILIVGHGGVSIPIACYFNHNIPTESLLDHNLVLNNCEVVSYKNESKKKTK